jgi:hypothetical protein
VSSLLPFVSAAHQGAEPVALIAFGQLAASARPGMTAKAAPFRIDMSAMQPPHLTADFLDKCRWRIPVVNAIARPRPCPWPRPRSATAGQHPGTVPAAGHLPNIPAITSTAPDASPHASPHYTACHTR